MIFDLEGLTKSEVIELKRKADGIIKNLERKKYYIESGMDGSGFYFTIKRNKYDDKETTIGYNTEDSINVWEVRINDTLKILSEEELEDLIWGLIAEAYLQF